MGTTQACGDLFSAQPETDAILEPKGSLYASNKTKSDDEHNENNSLIQPMEPVPTESVNELDPLSQQQQSSNHDDVDNDDIKTEANTTKPPESDTIPPDDAYNDINNKEDIITSRDDADTDTNNKKDVINPTKPTMYKSEDKQPDHTINATKSEDKQTVQNKHHMMAIEVTNLTEQFSNVSALSDSPIPSAIIKQNGHSSIKAQEIGKELAMQLSIDKMSGPIPISQSMSERRILSRYSVQFTITEDRADTIFKITSFNEARRLSIPDINNPGSSNYISKNTKVEWSLDYYWDDTDHVNRTFFWAIFMFKRYYRLSQGYFKILDYIEDDSNDNKENKENEEYPKKHQFDKPNITQSKSQRNKISSTHLKAFLYFVHHPKIRSYLSINHRQKWDQHDVIIYIDQQKYTLQFFNGKDINQCQALSILKHGSERNDDEKKENDMETDKKTKSKVIHALYFPKPNQAIEWRWYDTTDGSFIPYSNDVLQTLEFEASYYGNIQANFPKSNKLFKSKLNTSIFDHCYLPRFSKIRSLQTPQQQRFCMRYTLCPIGNSGDYDIVIDQIRLQSSYGGTYARTVKRHFDRQKYLINQMGHIGTKSLTRRVESLNCIITTRSTSINQSPNEMKYTLKQKVSWMAMYDKTPSKDNEYKLTITSKFDDTMTSPYSITTIKTAMGVEVTTVNIKEAELITNKYEDYMWTRFRTKRNRHCNFVNGFWDISFNDDNKYKQLRQHLDAILSTLQHHDILQHFKIDPKNGGFLGNKDKENEDKILQITIDDEYEYELLWYNIDAQKCTETHAIHIKQKNGDKTLKMYIMYFPKPDRNFNRWQWYDNNACKYMDYTEQNELLQLECSYLSNLYLNYPKYVIQRDTQRSVGYFSHCIFNTFMKNKKIQRNKLYVLRYSVIEELHNKCVVEQVAYQNGADFARTVRRITSSQLEKEKMDQYIPRMEFEYDPQTAITHGHIKIDKVININDTFPETKKDENTFEGVVKRFSMIFIQYQEWLCLSNLEKPPGFLPKLAAIYQMDKTPKQAIIKLRDDFGSFSQQIITKTVEEMTKISDNINREIQSKFGHKSDKCLCVERTHRDRRSDNSKERYFGFEDKNEIITQQLLDSYHCVFLHLYDIKTVKPNILSPLSVNTFFGDDDEESDDAKDFELAEFTRSITMRFNRQSSIITGDHGKKNKKKFNTYTTYDTGYRYYYWDYYKNSIETKIIYQDNVADPGNKNYRFKDWYIKSTTDKLKEEILSLNADNFGCSISKNQYDLEYEKAIIHKDSEQGRILKCNDSNWENMYGLEKNSLITIHHLLAIQFYCSFTDAAQHFIATFRRKTTSEKDEELKKRHSFCALWAKYLRECIEGFGLRLRKGLRGIPRDYYRGITDQFLFEKTILRFNGPLSTSVSEAIAENFANDNNNKSVSSDNGLVLTLKPHWGDCRGNIRAWQCQNYSDYPWEQEYLFIGGLEPLVIYNIRDIKGDPDIYFYKIHAMNNIHQIFEGMACKFEMHPKLIDELIDNRLMDINDINNNRNNDYISQIFDFYCDGVTEISIRLSLMDQSYKQITKIFLDNFNTLKLEKIIKLFPKCKKITLCDGYNHQLIAPNMEYKYTILGITEICIKYVNHKQHPLKHIFLETNEEIESKLFNHYQHKLGEIGWKCKSAKFKMNENKNNDSGEETEYKYKIWRSSKSKSIPTTSTK